MEELERLSENDEFRVLYDAEKMRRKEINSARLDGYDDGYNNGYGSGYDAGAKEKGIEIAKNLLNIGTSNEDIMKVTGLSEEEINNLIEELNN